MNQQRIRSRQNILVLVVGLLIGIAFLGCCSTGLIYFMSVADNTSMELGERATLELLGQVFFCVVLPLIVAGVLLLRVAVLQFQYNRLSRMRSVVTESGVQQPPMSSQ